MSRHALVAEAVVGVGKENRDAVIVENGRIAAVTTRRQLGDTPRTEHRGAVIAPAFVDSHLHPLGYAALIEGTSLKDATSVRDVEDRLGEASSRLGPGRALMAQRLDDTTLGRLPTRHDLDTAVPDRPVIAYRYCGHVAVVNTVVLRMAGLTETTPDPPGGSLDRDESGRPTGVLRETAMALVTAPLEPLLPPPSPQAVLHSLEGLVGVGIGHIGAMAATGRPLWCGVGNEIDLLCELAPDLPVALDVMVIADTPDEMEQAAKRITRAGGRLRFWGWKTFADGSLGGHTAAMREPYSDSDARGTLRLDPPHAEHMARLALDLGGVVAVHAIGDRAIDTTLDLFDRLLGGGVTPSRLRIEHVSVASTDQISRLGSRGVVASIQPSFLTSESNWVPARLGPERNPYRFRSMLESGVRMIAGSDCPVERPDPLTGIAAAVHRSGWEDDEHLTAGEAISLYTSAPADHFRLPPPLAPGSPADMVVIQGKPGSTEATVTAVYQQGEPRTIRQIPWPG